VAKNTQKGLSAQIINAADIVNRMPNSHQKAVGLLMVAALAVSKKHFQDAKTCADGARYWAVKEYARKLTGRYL
jgi:hypothetical protein